MSNPKEPPLKSDEKVILKKSEKTLEDFNLYDLVNALANNEKEFDSEDQKIVAEAMKQSEVIRDLVARKIDGYKFVIDEYEDDANRLKKNAEIFSKDKGVQENKIKAKKNWIKTIMSIMQFEKLAGDKWSCALITKRLVKLIREPTVEDFVADQELVDSEHYWIGSPTIKEKMQFPELVGTKYKWNKAKLKSDELDLIKKEILKEEKTQHIKFTVRKKK